MININAFNLAASHRKYKYSTIWIIEFIVQNLLCRVNKLWRRQRFPTTTRMLWTINVDFYHKTGTLLMNWMFYSVCSWIIMNFSRPVTTVHLILNVMLLIIKVIASCVARANFFHWLIFFTLSPPVLGLYPLSLTNPCWLDVLLLHNHTGHHRILWSRIITSFAIFRFLVLVSPYESSAIWLT